MLTYKTSLGFQKVNEAVENLIITSRAEHPLLIALGPNKSPHKSNISHVLLLLPSRWG